MGEPKRWEILTTRAADRWLETLAPKQAERITKAITLLAETGPTLGRPAVDSMKGARTHNLKELRAGTLRVLFAFDSHERAVLLTGGDKRGQWQRFYARAIPTADRLFGEHQRNSGAVQVWRATDRAVGTRSSEVSR
jgi:hypothetical protein